MIGKQKNILSGRAAARYLDMADATFKRLVDAGEIPFWQDPLTGRKRYPRLALDEFLKSFATNVKRGSAA